MKIKKEIGSTDLVKEKKMKNEKFKIEANKATFNYKSATINLVSDTETFIQIDYHGISLKYLGTVDSVFPFVDELVKHSFWLFIEPVRSCNPIFKLDSLSTISNAMVQKNNMKVQLEKVEKLLNSPLVDNKSRIKNLKIVRSNFARKTKSLKLSRQHADREYAKECSEK